LFLYKHSYSYLRSLIQAIKRTNVPKRYTKNVFTPKRLKELREQNGETQVQVAELLHVSVRAYGNCERGYRTPGPDELEKLAKHFNVPIQYFLGESLNDEGYLMALSGKSLNELTDEQKAAVKNVIETFLQSNTKKKE
jgi:transcriptional regulator with XRE-family HTH domain